MNSNNSSSLWGSLDKDIKCMERDLWHEGSVIPVLVAEISCAAGLRDDGSGIWDVSDVGFSDKMGSAPPGSGS